jgi:hypothetical protein
MGFEGKLFNAAGSFALKTPNKKFGSLSRKIEYSLMPVAFKRFSSSGQS